MAELEQKLNRIQQLLKDRNLDALLLQRISSFAWATCGAASYVNTAAMNGASSLLITPARRYVITTNIEAPRLEREERLSEQGWQLYVTRWYEPYPAPAIVELTRGMRVGADGPFPGATDLSDDMARLRARLLPEEIERFRSLGRLCAQAMNIAVRSVYPGQSEFEIAARLAHEAQSRDIQPIVNLIATDERVFAFRHPLPTGKKLERYAMLVLSGRKAGLVCSMTRLVHFGPIPDDVGRKAEAVARVDATYIAETRPGKTLSEILRKAQTVYAESGFADEWQFHHQGGAAGYESREYLATPNSGDTVSEGQAFAWNPSIAGSKSEDTIIVAPKENEVITAISDWPSIMVSVAGQTIPRPRILVAP